MEAIHTLESTTLLLRELDRLPTLETARPPVEPHTQAALALRKLLPHPRSAPRLVVQHLPMGAQYA
jgi:hypothetical protein